MNDYQYGQKQYSEPQYTQTQVREYIDYFKQNPAAFDDKQLEMLKQYANYYQIPLAKDELDNSFDILRAVRTAGEGFVSGFTTFNIGEQPKNKYERIVRAVGQLAGFVGYMPAAPLKLLKLHSLARAAKALSGRSVPMLFSKWATKKAGGAAAKILGAAAIGRGSAAVLANTLLGAKGEVARSLVAGAFRLGASSGISSWQGGVDEMIKGFAGGAVTGAAFGAIGNLVKVGHPLGDKIVRSLASSAYVGVPSTMQGATSEEQVYQYLLGAWFGYRSGEAYKTAAGQHIQKMGEAQRVSKTTEMPDPKKIEGWKNLSVKAQQFVLEKAPPMFEKATPLAYQIAKAMGIDQKKIQEALELFKTAEQKGLDKAVVQKQLSKIIGKNVNQNFDLDYEIPGIETLQTKVRQFTEKTLKSVYEVPNEPNQSQKNLYETATKIQLKWNELSKDSFSSKINPAAKMVEWLKSDKGMGLATIDKTDLLMWRQMGIRITNETFVSYVQGREDGSIKNLKFGDAVTDNGKNMNIAESKKLGEQVYALEYFQKYGKAPEDAIYKIMGFVSTKTRDINLSRFREYLIRKNNFNQVKAETEYLKTMSSYMDNMDSEGYGYIGGKADTGRQYYFKYHPGLDGMTAYRIKREYRNMKNLIGKADVKTKLILFKDLRLFVNDHQSIGKERAEILYKKAFLSNAFYETAMNGFKYTDYNKLFTLDSKGKPVGNWVNSAIQYNKRSQIWLTAGYRPEMEYFNPKGTIKDIVGDRDNPSLNFIISKEADSIYDQKKLTKDSPASQYLETTDGHILVRRDVIDPINDVFAMTTKSKKNKSFIISPHKELGALLGKYMFVVAGAEESAAMMKSKIHFKIPQSSAKQFGLRSPYFTDYNKNGVLYKSNIKGEWKLAGKSQLYQLPVRNIRGTLSEVMDVKSHHLTRWSKQLYTNLSPYMFSTEGNPEAVLSAKKTIADIYNTLSSRPFEGSALYNKKVESYFINPDPSTQKELLKNLDKVGIKYLMKLFASSKHSDFTSKAILQLAKMDKDFISDLVNEGELTKSEYESAVQQAGEYGNTVEKHIALDKGTMAALTHKYSLPYINNVIKNYVQQRLTRPTTGNAFKQRINPLTKEGLRRTDKLGSTADLEHNSKLFFFDEGDRSLEVAIWAQKWKLGDLWNKYKGGKEFNSTKMAEAKEFFRVLTVRVPADSPSGAQVLRFGGFTGREGHGITMHPRMLQLLGGADGDGDTAFVFFGGKGKTYAGSFQPGIKKSWKDLYEAQADEFYKNNMLKDSKTAIDPIDKISYREMFAVTGHAKELAEHSALRWSPYQRMLASANASEGRNLLGSVVNMRAIFNSAYSAMMEVKNKGEAHRIEVKVGKKKVWADLIIKAKDNPIARSRFRDMSAALVKLTADSTSEAGIKDYNTIFKKVFGSIFDYKVKLNGKTLPVDLEAWQLKKGLIHSIGEISKAIYGKNYTTGKNYTPMEMRVMLMASNDIDRVGREKDITNTFMTMIGKDLNGVDLGISPLTMVNPEYVKQKHAEWTDGVTKYKGLQKLLGRESMDVPYTVLEKAFNTGIMDPGTYAEIIKATKPDDTYHKFFSELYASIRKKAGKITGGKIINEKLVGGKVNEKNIDWRRNAMAEVFKFSEDILTQNLNVFTSAEILLSQTNKAKDAGVSNKLIKWILKRGEDLKVKSWLKTQEKRRYDLKQDYMEGKEEAAIKPEGEVIKGAMDITQINALIIQDKAMLTAKYPKQASILKKLYDVSMLSSYTVGKGMTPKKYELKMKDLNQQLKDAKGSYQKKKVKQEITKAEEQYKANVGTEISRLGWLVDKLETGVLQEWQDVYNKNFKEFVQKPSIEEAKEINIKTNVLSRLFDKSKKPIKEDVREYNDYDKGTRKFLDEIDPFIGLHKGTLDKRGKAIYRKLKGHFDFYTNAAENFNYFVRDVLKKNMNEMTYDDFDVMNRVFDYYKDGSLLSRLFRPTKKGGKEFDVTHWVYKLFPRQINKDFMRTAIKFVEREGPYRTKYGTIMGKVKKPTQTFGLLREYANWALREGNIRHQTENMRLIDLLEPYLGAVKDPLAMHSLAIRHREGSRIMKDYLYMKYRDDPKEAGRQWAGFKAEADHIDKKLNWKELKKKTFIVVKKVDGKTTPITVTGEQYIKDINNIYTKFNKMTLKWQQGDPAKLEEFILRDKRGRLQYWDNNREFPKMDLNKFLTDIALHLKKGIEYPLDLGIDGIRKMLKHNALDDITKMMKYKNTTPEQRKDLGDQFKRIIAMKVDKTGELPGEVFWHHTYSDKAVANDQFYSLLDKIDKSKATKEAKNSRRYRLVKQYHKSMGDLPNEEEFRQRTSLDLIDDIISPVMKNKAEFSNRIKWFEQNQKVGSQYSRDFNFSGWSVDPEVYDTFMNNIIKTYYKQITQLVSRHLISDFNINVAKGWDPKQTKAWSNVMKLYVQQAIGNPIVIPQSMRDMKEMAFKYSLYAGWSDDHVANRLDKIAKKLGIKKVIPGLPDELHDLDKLTPREIVQWSNLEAKYQFATLLVHPKASMNNLFGGTLHTAIYAGTRNLKNARNIKYLRNNINRDWESLKDVEISLRKLGVTEEFMLNEINTNAKFKSEKWRRAGKEVIDAILKNPNVPDAKLSSIVKKNGIAEAIFKKSTWFMQRPERTLRRDAFMASLLQAYDNLGGTIKDPLRSPFLVEMARKGVEATQFLYGAPNRPMFATSGLGKVMARFQLWSWNSVRFRNDVIDQAHIHGWKEGTPEFDKFRRMATVDMMMIALSNVFMYSLFETALPAPLNWIQDMADLVFGDERERDRAFFGSYPGVAKPLQLFTPPALRMVGPTINAFMKDDFSKMSSYYMWTIFPFGRIGRDIYGITKNPTMTLEKTLGIPYRQLGVEAKKIRENKHKIYIPHVLGYGYGNNEEIGE